MMIIIKLDERLDHSAGCMEGIYKTTLPRGVHVFARIYLVWCLRTR